MRSQMSERGLATLWLRHGAQRPPGNKLPVSNFISLFLSVSAPRLNYYKTEGPKLNFIHKETNTMAWNQRTRESQCEFLMIRTPAEMKATRSKTWSLFDPHYIKYISNSLGNDGHLYINQNICYKVSSGRSFIPIHTL